MVEKTVPFFEMSTEEYEKHLFNHARDEDELFAQAAHALSLKGASVLLDLCCGTGRELDEIMKISPWISVTGLDASPGLLAKLLAKPYASRLTLINCTSLVIPFAKCAYDGAVSCFLSHHLTAEQRLFLYKDVFEALRVGGKYVEADITAASPAGGPAPGLGEYSTTAETTLRLLREAGFLSADVRWQKDHKAIFVARKDVRK